MVGQSRYWVASIGCTTALCVTKLFPLGLLISRLLQGRGPNDLVLIIQNTLEEAGTNSQPMNGFVLDLVKAFNTISRGRMQAVFDHLNLPRADTSAWLRSLQHLVRFPTFHGKLGDPVVSSTGLPEGDSMSVVGMLGLSHVKPDTGSAPRLTPTTGDG